MLYVFLSVIAIAVIGLAALISARPADFRISRSTKIAARPETVFALVNDFHEWEAWSPWATMDPSMKATYEGPDAGEGAKYAWTGNRKVGEGRMMITESRPGEVVRIRLEFLKPMTATNAAEFTFVPEGNGTKVTWTMSGSNDCFMAKAFSLVCSMDNMVGKEFEKGLASMKAVAEASA